MRKWIYILVYLYNRTPGPSVPVHSVHRLILMGVILPQLMIWIRIRYAGGLDGLDIQWFGGCQWSCLWRSYRYRFRYAQMVQIFNLPRMGRSIVLWGVSTDDHSVEGIYSNLGHFACLEKLLLDLDYNGVSVNLNDTVTTGQVIGKSDNTVISTGPHLHFATVKNGVIGCPFYNGWWAILWQFYYIVPGSATSLFKSIPVH